ncbi:MAG: phytanoyl-CoA dioxygenase family protein [Pedobacter sp.]
MNLNKIKSDFERDGFVRIPNFLSKAEVAEIGKNFNRIIEDVVPAMPREAVFYEGETSKDTLKQLIDIHKHDPYFDGILKQGKFKAIAEWLLDDEVVGKTLEYFNKPPLIGKATPPHQDGFYFMLNPSVAVTMWMALEPADLDNGCVQYVIGSHRGEMRPHGRTQTLGFSQGIINFGLPKDEQNLVSLSAEPGDLLVHHSLTVHLAGANKSQRSRKALGLIYFGKSAKEDLQAKAAYQQLLQSQHIPDQRKI